MLLFIFRFIYDDEVLALNDDLKLQAAESWK